MRAGRKLRLRELLDPPAATRRCKALWGHKVPGVGGLLPQPRLCSLLTTPRPGVLRK